VLGGGLVLDRAQRDALRCEAAAQLEDVGVIATALRAGRWEDARRLREQFVGLTRLLDDLGWAPEDDGDAFALTMPLDWLARTVNRMQAGTACTLERLLEAPAQAREQIVVCSSALNVYHVILVTIAELRDAGAMGGVAENADEIVRRELGRAPIRAFPLGRSGGGGAGA
jgi:hypothetical protein